MISLDKKNINGISMVKTKLLLLLVSTTVDSLSLSEG